MRIYQEPNSEASDFMFLRSLRKGVNGTAAKVGWTVIAAVLGAVIWLVNGGLHFWKGQ